MRNVTTLVTGPSGFLETALRRALAAGGGSGICVSAGTRDLPAPARCEMLYHQLIGALRHHQVDVVFHLAGTGLPYVEGLPPHYQYWANVGTTKAVVDTVEAAGFRGRVIFASSASVYGDSGLRKVTEDDPLKPCSEYGHAKAKAERCLLERISHRCDVRIARIFHVFGPGQRKLVVYDLASRLVAGEQPLVVRSTGEEMRDFVFIDDAVRALIFLGTELPTGVAPRIVNVCSGVPMRIGELVRLLLQLDGRGEHKLRFQPAAAPNPVTVCVGAPERLASLGLIVPPASAQHFVDTLSWIRGGDPQ